MAAGAPPRKGVTGNTCTICGEWPDLVCPCQTTRYCSKECQAVDWKQRGHKAVCKKIRAEREEAAKRSEAPTPPSSPKPERPVFYGPAERTHADEVRARIKADHEAARVKREANPEPEPGPYGRRCPVCLDDWDVNKSPNFCYFCLARTCDSCATKSINTRGEMCPMCQECPPPGLDKDELQRHLVAVLQRHVDNDVPAAICQLGCLHQEGECGFVKSAKEAARLYERAVALGDVDAMVFMAGLYEKGDAADESEEKTKKSSRNLYRLAANRGHVGARFKLGLSLISTKRAKDREDGMQHLARAAEQGYIRAEYATGALLVELRGEEAESFDEGIRLLRRAAAKGHQPAINYLAERQMPT